MGRFEDIANEKEKGMLSTTAKMDKVEIEDKERKEKSSKRAGQRALQCHMTRYAA